MLYTQTSLEPEVLTEVFQSVNLVRNFMFIFIFIFICIFLTLKNIRNKVHISLPMNLKDKIPVLYIDLKVAGLARN